MDHKIFVTGIGFITSIGNDRITVTDSLRKLASGIEKHPELQVDSSPVKVAGTVKEVDLELRPLPQLRSAENYVLK